MLCALLLNHAPIKAMVGNQKIIGIICLKTIGILSLKYATRNSVDKLGLYHDKMIKKLLRMHFVNVH